MRLRRVTTIIGGAAVALAAAAATVVAPTTAAGATTPPDVPATSPIASDVAWVVSRGVITAWADGSFRPATSVTRQSMALYLYRLAHPHTAQPACTRAPFADVPRTSGYCGAITWLSQSNVQPGAATLPFAPASPLTRRALAVWLYRMAQPGKPSPRCATSLYTDVAVTSGFCGPIVWAHHQGVMVGTTGTTFAPVGTVSRGVAATALHRFSDVLHPVLGADASYPQCLTAGSSAAGALPNGQAFAVVGVNAGLPRTTNPCLRAELAWAGKSVGGAAQQKVQLFVNTANPGGLHTASWPRSGSSTRYGTCTGTNSRACAYLYGQARAREDAGTPGVGTAAAHTWWLDVEVANTWDTSAGGTARNVAVLEGMVDYFRSLKVAGIGLYSTAAHWKAIVGSSVATTSPLYRLAGWVAGASDIGGARRACGAAPLTAGGRVRLTQYTDAFDHDHSCV
jgi:hypothetical protein